MSGRRHSSLSLKAVRSPETAFLLDEADSSPSTGRGKVRRRSTIKSPRDVRTPLQEPSHSDEDEDENERPQGIRSLSSTHPSRYRPWMSTAIPAPSSLLKLGGKTLEGLCVMIMIVIFLTIILVLVLSPFVTLPPLSTVLLLSKQTPLPKLDARALALNGYIAQRVEELQSPSLYDWIEPDETLTLDLLGNALASMTVRFEAKDPPESDEMQRVVSWVETCPHLTERARREDRAHLPSNYGDKGGEDSTSENVTFELLACNACNAATEIADGYAQLALEWKAVDADVRSVNAIAWYRVLKEQSKGCLRPGSGPPEGNAALFEFLAVRLTSFLESSSGLESRLSDFVRLCIDASEFRGSPAPEGYVLSALRWLRLYRGGLRRTSGPMREDFLNMKRSADNLLGDHLRRLGFDLQVMVAALRQAGRASVRRGWSNNKILKGVLLATYVDAGWQNEEQYRDVDALEEMIDDFRRS